MSTKAVGNVVKHYAKRAGLDLAGLNIHPRALVT
jgi:hypothetical protein